MLDSARTYAAIGGAAGATLANALTYRAENTSRVCFFMVADSNGVKDGYGLLNGMHAALNARFGAYGSGIVAAKHMRSTGARASGLDQAWTYWEGNNLPSAVRNSLAFTGASWTNATLTLSGTFTGYTPKAGDTVEITGGTSLGAGTVNSQFYVQAGSTVGNIILDRSIGTSASAVAGDIGNGPGASSFSFIPTAIHQAWNVPFYWSPMGAGLTYHASGSHFLQHGSLVIPKHGPLSCNSRIQFNLHQILIAAGGSGRLDVGHWNGDPVTTATWASLGNTAISSSGTDGTLSQVRVALAAGDRVVSGYGGKEYFLAGPSLNNADVGPNAYLAVSCTDLDATTGVSMTGLLCKGGMSLWKMAKTARDVLTDTTLQNFFYMLKDECGSSTGGGGVLHAVCLVNSGFNDHVETTTSLGSAATDSSTAAGFVDNLKVLIGRLRAIFDAMVVATTLPAGSTLTFVVIPSHPMSDTTTTPGTGSNAAREGITQTYRQGVLELAQSRTDVIPVDLFTLLGPSPFSALYNRRLTMSNTGAPASDDVLHLTPAGYRWLAGRIVGALDYAGRRINYVGPTRLFGG